VASVCDSERSRFGSAGFNWPARIQSGVVGDSFPFDPDFVGGPWPGRTAPTIEHGRAAQETANALDAPAQKALTSDSPTHEPIGKAIFPEARLLEK